MKLRLNSTQVVVEVEVRVELCKISTMGNMLSLYTLMKMLIICIMLILLSISDIQNGVCLLDQVDHIYGPSRQCKPHESF